MSAHWIVAAAAAILIPTAACIRSGHRIQSTAPPTIHATPAVAAPARPSLWAQINDALESWEDSAPVIATADAPRSATVEIRGELITCPKDDDQNPAVRTWIEWRRQALEALPESLRQDSDHQRAIDETFRMAVRGFLKEEVAASYVDVSIISRPPVGGYDIGGVGFTDIDEQAAGESLQNGGLDPRVINYSNVQVLELDTLREQERQTIDELRAVPLLSNGVPIVSFLFNRGAAAAPDPPADPHQQTLDFWSKWKKQAIAALPENLRENSEYQAAIEATYQAALPSLGVTPHPSAPASVGVSKMD